MDLHHHVTIIMVVVVGLEVLHQGVEDLQDTMKDEDRDLHVDPTPVLPLQDVGLDLRHQESVEDLLALEIIVEIAQEETIVRGALPQRKIELKELHCNCELNS